jgi:L-ribulose-5-phosphate 3-epimerase
MFKKGIITDEISQDLKTALELASRYKLNGIEIRSVWDKGPHQLDRNDVNEMRKIIEDTDLEVCAVSSPFFKCDIDSRQEIENNIEILKRCIEVANNLGTHMIRGFTFWKKGKLEDYIGKILKEFEKPVEILKKEKITLVLENEPSVFASNALMLDYILEKINSTCVKAVWDPGNSIYDPDGEIPFPDGYERIKNHMVHMHLKDAKVLTDGKIVGVPLGDGNVDYVGHFKELLKSGYKGYVVLETHYRPEHEISAELLTLPGGSAFSYLGYEASELCLKRWEEILKKSGKQAKKT